MQNITNLDEIFNFKSMWNVYCHARQFCMASLLKLKYWFKMKRKIAVFTGRPGYGKSFLFYKRASLKKWRIVLIKKNSIHDSDFHNSVNESHVAIKLKHRIPFYCWEKVAWEQESKYCWGPYGKFLLNSPSVVGRILRLPNSCPMGKPCKSPPLEYHTWSDEPFFKRRSRGQRREKSEFLNCRGCTHVGLKEQTAMFGEAHRTQKGRLPLGVENNPQQVSALTCQLVDGLTDIGIHLKLF